MKFLVVIIFVLENVNIFIFTLVYVIYRDVSLSRLRVSFNFVKNSLKRYSTLQIFCKKTRSNSSLHRASKTPLKTKIRSASILLNTSEKLITEACYARVSNLLRKIYVVNNKLNSRARNFSLW